MFIQELMQYQIQYKQNVFLKEYTTLHIGGRAHIMIFPKSVQEIEQCLKLCQKYDMIYVVLGKGSNILASDQGYHGVIINLTMFCEMKRLDGQRICVQSGATLKNVCDFCLQQELTGLEFACGIPGTIGGAVYMVKCKMSLRKLFIWMIKELKRYRIVKCNFHIVIVIFLNKKELSWK